MPINIPSNDFQITDFSGGWMPDLDPAAVPEVGLLDVNNLLPDRLTGVLETRKGYRRFSDFSRTAYRITTLYPYNVAHGTTNAAGRQYLIAVVTNDTNPDDTDDAAAADNVEVWAIDVVAGTSVRVDNDDRQWRHSSAKHWGVTVDNKFYGGSENDPVYSYYPYFSNGTANPEPWEPEATMGTTCGTSWADSTAYVVGERVKRNGVVFVCISDHTSSGANDPKPDGSDEDSGAGRNADRRWERVGPNIAQWADATAYEAGDLVAYLVEDNNRFPRGYIPAGNEQTRQTIFRCVADHTSATGAAKGEPYDGTSVRSYWEVARGPVSNVAVYHANRLFIRDSDAGTGILHYSRPVESDGKWRVDKWAISDINETSAGYIPVESADGDDIRALHPMGDRLVICKRRSTHVLVGTNATTWRRIRISDKGCIYKRAICEHDGYVYFFGDQGLQVTDGAIVEEVENGNVLREWLRDNLEFDDDVGGGLYDVAMWAWDERIWISFPSSAANVTLVYDIPTKSFWKVDFTAWQAAVNRVNGIDQLFFTEVNTTGANALVFQYDKSDAGDADDSGGVTYIATAIPWHMRTSWWTFGTGREQRRLRRLWAMVRAANKTLTWKAYKDHVETEAWSTDRTTHATNPISWIEGKILQNPSAVSFKLSGTASPAAVQGFEFHTEPLRKRYHWS